MDVAKKRPSKFLRDPRLTKKPGQRAAIQREPVAFRLPIPLIQQLNAMAARQGKDRSSLLYELLERGFLSASLAEMVGSALEKIDFTKSSNEAVLALLEEVSERVSLLEVEINRLVKEK